MSIPAGDIYAPYWATYQSGVPSFANRVIDAEGEKLGFVVEAPQTGTISKVHIMCKTISSAPTADYDIRLETVDTGDGLPTGTLFDTNTNGALTIIAGDDDEWLPVTLTASGTVTRGDNILAVVIQPPANPDTGSISWVTSTDVSTGLPYACSHNGSVWSKVGGGPMVLLEYSDGSIPRIPNCFPWTIRGLIPTIYSDSTTVHRGNRFKLRVATEIVGVWILLDMDAPDVTVTLYSGLAEVERTLVLKKHHSGGTGGDWTQYAGYFSTPFNASADTLYKIAVENNYATASGTPIAFGTLFINPDGIEAKVWDHMPYAGLFSEFYRTESNDLSSWVDDANGMGEIGPIIRSIGS